LKTPLRIFTSVVRIVLAVNRFVSASSMSLALRASAVLRAFFVCGPRESRARMRDSRG
jgi:hypothetical protein